ncbi:unnamed protein product [Calypogeia fissa]
MKICCWVGPPLDLRADRSRKPVEGVIQSKETTRVETFVVRADTAGRSGMQEGLEYAVGGFVLAGSERGAVGSQSIGSGRKDKDHLAVGYWGRGQGKMIVLTDGDLIEDMDGLFVGWLVPGSYRRSGPARAWPRLASPGLAE